MKKFIACLILLSFALPSHAFFWNRKDKALEKELEGKGYAGTLPNLNDNIEKSKTKVSTPIFDAQEGFNDPSELKPVPKDNPAFIDIIQKKDKSSEYVDDANEIIPMLEKLVDCIDDNPLGLLACSKPRLVHDIVDIRDGMRFGLGLHRLYKLLPGFGRRHSGYAFDFSHGLLMKLVVFFALAVKEFELVLEILPYAVILFRLALQFGVLLVQLHFTLFQLVLNLLDLRILLIDIALMLALELKELFLGLENLFLFYIFAFLLRIPDDLLAFFPAQDIYHKYRHHDGYQNGYQ